MVGSETAEPRVLVAPEAPRADGEASAEGPCPEFYPVGTPVSSPELRGRRSVPMGIWYPKTPLLVLSDTRLTPAAKLVIIAILIHARPGNGWVCRASNARLAKECGLNVTYLRELLGLLVEAKRIAIEDDDGTRLIRLLPVYPYDQADADGWTDQTAALPVLKVRTHKPTRNGNPVDHAGNPDVGYDAGIPRTLPGIPCEEPGIPRMAMGIPAPESVLESKEESKEESYPLTPRGTIQEPHARDTNAPPGGTRHPGAPERTTADPDHRADGAVRPEPAGAAVAHEAPGAGDGPRGDRAERGGVGDPAAFDLTAPPSVAEPKAKRAKRAPAELADCQTAIDLWRRILLPLGFPDVTPGAWRDKSRRAVARISADPAACEALFRRVARSPWLRDTQRPDLIWVLVEGRERIERGKYDPRQTAPPSTSGSTLNRLIVEGIDCSSLPPDDLTAIRRKVMTAGLNRAAARQMAEAWLHEHGYSEVVNG